MCDPNDDFDLEQLGQELKDLPDNENSLGYAYGAQGEENAEWN